jgi:hypothetical protein
MKTTEAISDLFAALALAQSKIDAASKNATNPHLKNTYADLSAVWDACRESLTSNGLSVIQYVTFDTTAQRVLVTRLAHKTGQWIEDDGIPLMSVKQDMQGIGSAITYARRYGITALIGITQHDDDGNAASKPNSHHFKEQDRIADAPTFSARTTSPMSLSKVAENPGAYVCQVKTSKYYMKRVNSFTVAEANEYINQWSANLDKLPQEMMPFYRNMTAYWRKTEIK